MERSIASLSNEELLAATRDLVRRSCSMEADLLVHLGEIDERKLYLDRAFSSGKPTLINALTDPEVVYPRKSVLA